VGEPEIFDRLLSSVASPGRSVGLRDSGVVAPSASAPLAVVQTLPVGFCDNLKLLAFASGSGDLERLVSVGSERISLAPQRKFGY
jgi:hypothetical protein